MSRGREPVLRVEHLTRHFGGVRALQDVGVEAYAGEVVGIIGPNGSGKTTLINCVTGFVKPSAGKVLFRGRDITGMAPHRIADMGVARTFQIMRPYRSLPAFKNLVVALSSPRARRQGSGRHGDRDTVAVDILEDLGFERDSRVPFRTAGTLPTGYLKRLELGRCIALRPEVIICDEVFSGLSASETASMVPLIERFRNEGIAVVMVEHRLRELFQVAGRVIALSQGRKIAEGDPKSVLDHPLVRESYLGPGDGEESP